MKKLFTKIMVLCLVCIMTAMVICLPVAAEPCRIYENDPISIPNATPTIDGKIDAGEGWSKAAYLDENTCGHFWNNMQFTSTSEFYLAVSPDGLYFAIALTEGHAAYTCRLYEENPPEEGYFPHDYIDPKAGEYTITNYPEKTPDGTVIDGHMDEGFRTKTPADCKVAFWYANAGNNCAYSTGPDLIDKDYGFDGDVFALQIDPLGILNDECFFGTEDYVIQFNFGVFAGDVVKVKTSRGSDTDYTDKCKLAGKLTEDNIIIEAFLPKDVVMTELNNTLKKFDLDRTLTWEEFTAKDAVSRGAVCLMDRFEDPDAGILDTWGRFSTCCAVCTDGIEGWKVGTTVRGMGLKLVMPGVGGGDAPATQAQDTTTAANAGNGQSTTVPGNSSATTTAAAASTTKSASTGASSQSSGSGEASQTFDAGIAVALGALACSGIGFAYANRKKRK